MPATSESLRGVSSDFMNPNLQIVTIASTENCYNLCNAGKLAMLHIATMDKNTENPPNFLRDWRVFRGMTQADLAEMAGTSASMINHLENGARGLSHKWLVKLAPALGTTPGFILDHNPFELDRDILDIWNRSDDADRRRILSVAEALVPFRHEGAA